MPSFEFFKAMQIKRKISASLFYSLFQFFGIDVHLASTNDEQQQKIKVQVLLLKLIRYKLPKRFGSKFSYGSSYFLEDIIHQLESRIPIRYHIFNDVLEGNTKEFSSYHFS